MPTSTPSRSRSRTTRAVASKKTARLTLHDRLSRLTLARAEQLLGAKGKELIWEGGQFSIDYATQITFDRHALQAHFPYDQATVRVSLDAAHRSRLAIECSACDQVCAHQGATLAFILEEKTMLGLAKPPQERTPVESLTEAELVRQAMIERQERALTETFRLRSCDQTTPWTDYAITSGVSGKTYRVALRGEGPHEAFCSCPDFRKNTLGSCKHTIYALMRVKQRFSAKKRYQKYKPDRFYLWVRYGHELELRLETPEPLRKEVAKWVQPFQDSAISDPDAIRDLLRAVNRLEQAGESVTIYPDAEEHISRILRQDALSRKLAAVRKQTETHPWRRELLKTELLPYQLDGIVFAVGAGRAILADDMGLGKTIQGIGVAELLAREAGIKKVLVVCPTTLKTQWRNEIKVFSNLTCQLVLGPAAERLDQYGNEAFFTVCNYEQVLRDHAAIEQIPWDLIILDEAQRIKNWEAKTTAVIKSLRSPYALALTGTPLENRLDELYSIIEFIDNRRLGPAFRFFNRHRVTDQKGKVLGYKNLAEIREKLAPVLLRRTRASVLQQLPARTTEILRIDPTDEQEKFDKSQMEIVNSIVNKKFLTEMDLIRLQKALLLARMNADSTFLVTKSPPGYSTKLERLRELLENLCAEPDRKIVLFSEWTTMLGLIEDQLAEIGVEYVRLDGSIPQRQRQKLVHDFQRDPQCRLFITTNAGSTGLNLQAANTVINVDLPWNPALLEQRIGRAHRMGQKRPVQVYILITDRTIEERILGTLSAKHELALAVLDPDSRLNAVDLESGMEALKRRLEILLGAKEELDDRSEKARLEAQTQALRERRERVAEAGGQMLTAAFTFLSEMLPRTEEETAPRESQTSAFIRSCLDDCLETDTEGRLKLTVTLPDPEALDRLAQTLARLVPKEA